MRALWASLCLNYLYPSPRTFKGTINTRDFANDNVVGVPYGHLSAVQNCWKSVNAVHPLDRKKNLMLGVLIKP